jgi:hypothetical protein
MMRANSYFFGEDIWIYAIFGTVPRAKVCHLTRSARGTALNSILLRDVLRVSLNRGRMDIGDSVKKAAPD